MGRPVVLFGLETETLSADMRQSWRRQRSLGGVRMERIRTLERQHVLDVLEVLFSKLLQPVV